MIEQLGHYQILEQISKGGMGTVYKAYHPALDRHVAIKVLASRFSADPNFVGRFKKEAQIVARLEHPHILPVYDFAFDGDIAYLVMKLVEGTSLYAHIGPRGMAPDRAMKVLEAVAEALSHAHRRNIVHRDIKPDNILLDENEWVYLSDFGMAKMVSSTGPTSEGTIMGTPEYMSPEQAQGKHVDHRSDIYSLSVLVFHILTGTLPFKGAHPLATIKQVIYDPFPPITERNPGVPKLLDPLLQKGAAKNPEDRFSDVEEFVKMLGAVLTSAVAPKTQELFLRKSRIAIVPFATEDSDKAWMADAFQELLIQELMQSHELYLLAGDQIIRMSRNLSHEPADWNPDVLQRFFELSRVDYIILGKIRGNQIQFEMKISTTFETREKGTVEGTIPFHLASAIAQKIRSRLDVKEKKVVSVEQLFHGNLTLLQHFSMGVRAFREGRYLDAERAFRMAQKMEPRFTQGHVWLARCLQQRGFWKEAKANSRMGIQELSALPMPIATMIKAQFYEFEGQFQKAADLYHEFHSQFPEVIEYLVRWGEMLVKAEKLDEAANVFFEICEKEGRLGLGWQRLAWIEGLQEKYEQAWYHYKRAQKLYAAHQHSGGLAATYMGLADISERRKEWNTAIDYYQRSVESFHSLKWNRGVADAKYHLALAYKQNGSFASVLPLLKESMDLFHFSGDLYRELLCVREMLSEPLNSETALEVSERALQSASEMQDEKLLSSFIHLKLKWLVDSNQADEALKLYTNYFQMLVQNSPEMHFPLSQLQVSRALMKQERFLEAHQQMNQAIRSLKKVNSERLLVSALLIECELFLLERNLPKAHQIVEEAGLIVERMADKDLILQVDLMRAKVLDVEGQRVKLLQIYLRALKTAEDLGRGTLVHQIKGSIDQLRAINPH